MTPNQETLAETLATKIGLPKSPIRETRETLSLPYMVGEKVSLSLCDQDSGRGQEKIWTPSF